jgi:hypothetical protein
MRSPNLILKTVEAYQKPLKPNKIRLEVLDILTTYEVRR